MRHNSDVRMSYGGKTSTGTVDICGWPEHRSATVWRRMSAIVTDSVTVQALTSLAMAPKQRLNVLTTGVM